MPHISWPMRFVLPHHAGMCFPAETPASRFSVRCLPGAKGRRSAWHMRLALFFYDHSGGQDILPGTRTLDLSVAPERAPSKCELRKAFENADCWVDDSRRVVPNARDACNRDCLSGLARKPICACIQRTEESRKQVLSRDNSATGQPVDDRPPLPSELANSQTDFTSLNDQC